ncbi:hypothetical protein [Encephalitozoon cuniculi GB-M1]|uniref:Uncharacterized protein n=1 Tax=Encephalitozoon cuniculi (strain GB-M1) TaxID=284813 RepID=Q8SW13_ENCCU|nr:uncharacterized protein ECU03_1280 [Encephalitozoon cuniculi GB-M1]CAD26271.2 hypothetical protein [Encephalitozoon cuniculi GB-M1]
MADDHGSEGSEQAWSAPSRTRGYRKKSLDIVRLERAGDADGELLAKYKKACAIEAMEKPIENIVFRNRPVKIRDRMEFDNLVLRNVRKRITALSLPARDSKYMFVGVKEGFRGESTFRFSSEASEVYLLDQELNLRHVLSFGFGYCRRVETRQDGSVVRCVALFSDGFIRRFDFEENVKNMVEVDACGVVSFEIDWDHDLIFATDGTTLIWISQSSVVSVFSGVRGMIASIAIKRKPPEGNKSGTGSMANHSPPDKVPLEFYALGLNGRVLRFDCRFQERKGISFPSGYTFIKHLAQIDMVIIVDTLNNITKILYDEGDSQRTSTMFNHSLSCCRSNDKRILLGGFDGTIRHAKVNKRKSRTKTLFHLARNGDEVVLGHSEEELKALDPKGRPFNDSSERVVDLYIGRERLFAAYECGIIVGLTLL